MHAEGSRTGRPFSAIVPEAHADVCATNSVCVGLSWSGRGRVGLVLAGVRGPQVADGGVEPDPQGAHQVDWIGGVPGLVEDAVDAQLPGG